MPDNIAERILEIAAARFSAAEVFEENSETVSVDFEDNRLKEITTRQMRGVGLRIIHEGRIGFSSTTDLRRPERLVEMAAASAQFGDEAAFELRGQPDGAPQVELYDDRTASMSAERMVEMGREGLDLCRKANPGYLYAAQLGATVHLQRVLNTAGLDFEYPSTGMRASVEIEEVTDEGLLQVYEYRTWGTSFDTLADLARRVLDKMADASTVAPATPQEMPMIFTPKALDNLLMPIQVALNGKQVHKGASVLRGRIGEQVLDERLSISDDPTIPFAPGSCPVDDEGVPAARRPVFEGGVLRTYFADLQTAGLLGIEPTGHGFRGYSSRPSPSGTNTIIAPGETSLAEMKRDMERGLIIDETLGSGQSNVLAGEFSVNVLLGFLVEQGRIVGRVKDCMVAGNVYEVLSRVEAIGSERQWLGSVCAPPIMIRGLKLAAQG